MGDLSKGKYVKFHGAKKGFYVKPKDALEQLERKIEARLNRLEKKLKPYTDPMISSNYTHKADRKRIKLLAQIYEDNWVLSVLKVFRERFSAEKGSTGAKA